MAAIKASQDMSQAQKAAADASTKAAHDKEATDKAAAALAEAQAAVERVGK